ncbi:ABC transporter transmembrane domain-containing protein [Paenibacillus rhizoplanae]
MTYRISPTIAGWFVIVIPVLAAGMMLILKFAFPVFERAFDSYDALNKVVQENVRGIRVVKSYVREEHEVSKFQEVSQRIFLRRWQKQNVSWPMSCLLCRWFCIA